MNIIPFSFESHSLRAATDVRGNPVFVAADVSELLGYSETSKLLAHCKYSTVLGDVNKINKLHPSTKWIPEPDLYRATLKSNMAGAERVQDWVCEEVLPSIRKTGAYIPDIDSIDHLPPALAKQVGGIVKGIVHKELGQAINDALAYYLPDSENGSHLAS
jgi:prophage antirepressor-like protein